MSAGAVYVGGVIRRLVLVFEYFPKPFSQLSPRFAVVARTRSGLRRRLGNSIFRPGEEVRPLGVVLSCSKRRRTRYKIGSPSTAGHLSTTNNPYYYYKRYKWRPICVFDGLYCSFSTHPMRLHGRNPISHGLDAPRRAPTSNG